MKTPRSHRRRDPYIGHPLTRFRPMGSRSGEVDPEPTRRHVQHLLNIGMTVNMIARAAGLSPRTVSFLLNGTSASLFAPTSRSLLDVTPRPNSQQAIVLSYGARRRMEGLAMMGWPLRDLARHADVQIITLCRPRLHDRIQWRTHNTITKLYEDLSHIRSANPRTIAWAQSEGFVHPMLWDDIDDFYEAPSAPEDSGIPDEIVVQRIVAGRRNVVATRAERIEAVRILTARGMSADEIGDWIAISQRQVVRDRGLAVAV